MKTLTIKNKMGRIVTVEHKHGVKLISGGCELVVPESNNIAEPTKVEEEKTPEKIIIKTKGRTKV